MDKYELVLKWFGLGISTVIILWGIWKLLWFMNHFNNIAMVRKTNKTLQALIEKNNQLVIQYVDALEKINKEGEKRIRKADEVLNKYQNGNLSKKIADNQIKKLVGHSIDDYLKLHDHYKIFGEEQQDEDHRQKEKKIQEDVFKAFEYLKKLPDFKSLITDVKDKEKGG